MSQASLRINESLNFGSVLCVVDSARSLPGSRYAALTVLSGEDDLPSSSFRESPPSSRALGTCRRAGSSSTT